PDLDKSPIDQAIVFMATHIAIEKRSGRLPQSGPALDVTFMLSGKNDKPPFSGMRMGGYTDENNTLFFEAAVPETMTHSTHAPEYVATVLQDVVDNAIEFFTENEIKFDSEYWKRAITYLTESEVLSNKPH
ncbi:MAG: hypothetical protein PVF75_04635, partial [Granulosicoccaceae bacterium]